MNFITNSLIVDADRLAKSLVRAAKNLQNIAVVLEECPECAYLKNHEGKLAGANAAYNRLFGKGHNVAGRSPNSYLDKATSTIANCSDAMIAAGCSFVVFDHHGLAEDGQGRVDYRTVKVSLIGMGVPGLAVLGMTRMVGALPPNRLATVRDAWQRFDGLPEKAQQLAVLLSQGASQQEIAGQLKLSTRTITTLRTEVLEALSVENSHQLARWLGAIQDAGYIDLGL